VAKPPSWNEIRASAAAFAVRWADETNEKAEAQTFWNEFLAIFGIDRRRVAVFEKRAQRTSTAGGGFIDIFWPGTLIAEHKSAGKSLEDAEQQAIDYLESVNVDDFPGLVITSDFATMRVRDLGGDNEPYTFPLTKLAEEIDRLGHLAGYKKREFSGGDEEAANVKAAKLMGRLYEELSRNGYEGHDASILLVRLLFLMFGDDTGMWEKGLFAEFVDARTAPDGSDLGAQLAHLFQVLDKEETLRPAAIDELLARFPYVNGHLFAERIDIPAFDRRMRDELVTATEFDWGKISPAVFGSLFQAIKSKEARRELGEHYTTESAIMKAIGPLFLDELESAFIHAKDNKNRLEALHERLAGIRVLDPACGCGNFLVVAYRQLRRLELSVLKRLRELSGERQLYLDVDSLSRVRISQFFGIEIEEWPARIAETAMFLVDQQANQELALAFGRAPDRLPIKIAPVIHMGNALRVPWDTVMPFDTDSFIVGNPPFGGTWLLNDAQKEDLNHVWDGVRGGGNMDFVSCWHAIASRHIKTSGVKVAFVSTNSITQGQQAPVLGAEFAKHGVEIDFAHQTFAWSSEAPGQAAVHCVIVGFSRRGAGKKKTLFRYPNIKGEPLSSSATNINIYLNDAPDVLVTNRSAPLQIGTQLMLKGSQPTDNGYLSDISTKEAEEIRISDAVAAKYLRRLIGAQELINGEERWCLWLVDAEPGDIRASPELMRRVGEVRAMRMASKKQTTKDDAATPHLFQENRQPQTLYLAVPCHSSETRHYVPMALMGPEVIATNALLTVSNASVYSFAILQSSVFMAWNSAVSGRLESRFRISAEITYNNFPWPEEPANKTQIEAAAQAVIDTRNNHPGATLADLYDPLAMPRDLVEAHQQLDREVLIAYGLKASATESEILSNLFTRYSAITADLFTEPKPKRSRKAKGVHGSGK
jgi:type I restriction-modification system DNA methylase subunit